CGGTASCIGSRQCRPVPAQLAPEPFEVPECDHILVIAKVCRAADKRPRGSFLRAASVPPMERGHRIDPKPGKLFRVTAVCGLLQQNLPEADFQHRQGLSSLCKDKAPAGSRWNRPGLCRAAGGRGMGGTRPAQVQRSMSMRVPGLGSDFLKKADPLRAWLGCQPSAPRSTAWVVRSGAKSSTLSMARICASRARARCTRLLMVP